MAKDNTASLDPLIADLRNSLRKELALESVEDSVIYMRMTA